MLYFRMFDGNYVKNTPVTGALKPRDLDYLRRQLNYIKSVIEEYYLTRNFAVKNTNVLSRLVEHFPIMLETDFYDFINVLESRTTYLSKTFKFTSGIEAGIVHPPYFYGNDGDSVIISEFDSISKQEILSKWKTYNCCEVLLHPRNDTRFLLPLGNNDGSKGGLSVMSINMYALGVKYREFEREQYNKIREVEKDGKKKVILNKNHFICKYVLPGVLESHIDHVILNRIIDKFYGNEIVTPIGKHPFALQNIDDQLNRYVEQVLDYITKTDLNFTNILNCIPLIFSNNANELLALDRLPNTRQSNWSFVTSRLKYMSFLLDVSKKPGLSTLEIADWKLMIKRMERDSAFLGKFSYTTTLELKSYMEKIKNFKIG